VTEVEVEGGIATVAGAAGTGIAMTGMETGIGTETEGAETLAAIVTSDATVIETAVAEMIGTEIVTTTETVAAIATGTAVVTEIEVAATEETESAAVTAEMQVVVGVAEAEQTVLRKTAAVIATGREIRRVPGVPRLLVDLPDTCAETRCLLDQLEVLASYCGTVFSNTIELRSSASYRIMSQL